MLLYLDKKDYFNNIKIYILLMNNQIKWTLFAQINISLNGKLIFVKHL